MAKLLVTDSQKQTRVPFLRGILTRSLQDAGLPFDDAYQLASAIRQELSTATTITTRQLRAKILRHLRRSLHKDASRRYQSRREAPAAIMVQSEDGQGLPFSRAHHQRGLEACGLSASEAAGITRALYTHLVKRGRATIQSKHLDGLTHACLRRELGEAPAHRYLVWQDFVHSGRPLILLIGGTAGCGKSTTATSVANRLDIVRTQSTDMLREVMRMMVPERLLPVLHQSSFDAWKALPGSDDSETQLADGYYAQAEVLSVACEAVLNRALRERVSLILEGVHIQASLVEKIPVGTDALVIPIMLAVLDPKRLRMRIRGRAKEVPQRRAERYLHSFDAIWQLQSTLLSDADRSQIAIVENDDKEHVFVEVMRIVIDILSRDFVATPKEVFSRRRARAPAPELELS